MDRIYQVIGTPGGSTVVELPTDTAIYVLPPGASIEDEDSYKRLVTVQYIGLHEAYIRGLEGGMTTPIYWCIVGSLFRRGIRIVRYRHRGREIVIDRWRRGPDVYAVGK